MKPRFRIALLIDTSTTWGAGLIEGIAAYAHENCSWQLFLGPRGKYDRGLLPDEWNGDGVIARVTNPELADQLLGRGAPTVNVSWYRYGGDALPQCTCDPRAVARLAAEYFVSRGFRQFAYCGSALRPDYEDELGDAFLDDLDARGLNCNAFRPGPLQAGFLPKPEEQSRLNGWLQSLPKPTALLAFDSLQARQITDACIDCGVLVPQQIAVLGGEHDAVSSTVSRPLLSGIDHSPWRVGQAAAELLADLLGGRAARGVRVLLPPSRVLSRQSTDVVALHDDMLAAALRYITDNSCRKIRVSDVLQAVPVSRRALEKGFRRLLGRSPAEEIRRIRIDHAVQLLCDTSWPMPKIAAKCGFQRAELLARAFRKELGTTPSEFRRNHRVPATVDSNPSTSP